MPIERKLAAIMFKIYNSILIIHDFLLN